MVFCCRMTAEREIDYEALAQGAMRGIVRTVLARVAKSGLPGEHHFYIAFKTEAPGVVISKRLKEKYPEEMTVVLQHRFWDLIVTDERFEVKLTFDSIPERLVGALRRHQGVLRPERALRPAVRGLRYLRRLPRKSLPASQRESGSRGAPRAGAADRVPDVAPARAEKKPRAPRRPQPEKTAERRLERAPTRRRRQAAGRSSPPSRPRRRAPRSSASTPSARSDRLGHSP